MSVSTCLYVVECLPGPGCQAARLSEGGLSSSTVGPGRRWRQEVLLETGLGDGTGGGGGVIVVVRQVGVVHRLAGPHLPVLHTGQALLDTNISRGVLHYSARLGGRLGGELELIVSSWLGGGSGGGEGGIFKEKFHSEEAGYLEHREHMLEGRKDSSWSPPWVDVFINI